jgi:hypothetical protein
MKMENKTKSQNEINMEDLKINAFEKAIFVTLIERIGKLEIEVEKLKNK